MEFVKFFEYVCFVVIGGIVGGLFVGVFLVFFLIFWCVCRRLWLFDNGVFVLVRCLLDDLLLIIILKCFLEVFEIVGLVLRY